MAYVAPAYNAVNLNNNPTYSSPAYDEVDIIVDYDVLSTIALSPLSINIETGIVTSVTMQALSVTSQTPNVAAVDLTLPTITTLIRTSPYVELTYPSFTMDGDGGIWNGVVDITLHSLTSISYSGLDADCVLGEVTCESEATPGVVADIVGAFPELSSISYVSGYGEVEFTSFTSSSELLLDFPASMAMTIPPLSMTAEAFPDIVGVSSISFPTLSVDGIATIQPLGSGEITFPFFNLTSTTLQGSGLIGDCWLPHLSVSASSIAGSTNDSEIVFPAMVAESELPTTSYSVLRHVRGEVR